ncbi:MAG: NAD(P)H-binding protein [Alphaproteobacteria bacterium]
MSGRRVAVIGATGNVGRALADALLEHGFEVIAVARTRTRLRLLGDGVQAHPVDLGQDDGALREALRAAECVVNVAHAKFTRGIISALPGPGTRLITLGSTRKFTRFPDQKAAEVQDAEAAHAQGVNRLILHPAMIYGGSDNNISRVLKIVRWLPLVPLPLHGGALLQPIHRDDVVQCLLAAINRDTGNAPMILAGAMAMTYTQVILSCARLTGRRVKIISVPLWGMLGLAWLTRLIPGVPSIARDEVRRLLEDKAFDIAPMRDRLGVTPCTFEEGLARMGLPVQ